MYIGLHVKYRYSCQILMSLEFSQQIFEKTLNNITNIDARHTETNNIKTTI